MIGMWELKDIKSLISKRLKSSIPDIVFEKLQILLQDYPETKQVYLVGSYANGSYVDDMTPEYFKEWRKRTKGRIKNSDVDFYILPTPKIIISTEEYDLITFSYFRYNRYKKLIYDQENSS